MPKPLLISINGQFTDNVSAADRGFLYGDSLYEVCPVYQGMPFGYELHCQRMKRNAELCYFRISEQAWSNYDQMVKSHILEHIRRFEEKDLYCRWVLSRGTSDIGLSPNLPSEPIFLVYTMKINPHPDHVYRNGIKIQTVNIRRNHPNALPGWIKSGNYLNNILAVGKKDQAFDDVLMLSTDGQVAESSISNIFFVHEEELLTPPTQVGILDGITRRMVMQLASENNIKSREVGIMPQDIPLFQESFLSSSVKGITPVSQIDKHKLRSAEASSMTNKIRTLFERSKRERRWP